MKVITTRELTREYVYTEKEAGLLASVKSLFVKKKKIVVALNNFTFEVNRGECIGLIGPNGAGKTTLIKLLTGIIPKSKGEISVLGYDPATNDNRFKSKIAVVMGQKSQLWWDLPAIDSFRLNKEIYGVSECDFRRKLKNFTEMFQLDGLLHKQVRQLSLGERMKMEVVACLFHDPEIIYLDEPTIGLDAISQKRIRMLIKDINEKMQVTILLTSHYMADIESVCNRVLLINKGVKLYDGPLNDLLRRFREFRIITVHLKNKTPMRFHQDIDVLELGDYIVKVKVPFHRSSDFIRHIMSAYDVTEIEMEDENIEDIIEKIYSVKDEVSHV